MFFPSTKLSINNCVLELETASIQIKLLLLSQLMEDVNDHLVMFFVWPQIIFKCSEKIYIHF